MPAAHLILFSRAPVAGATKTRLAARVGADAAKDFHVACLLDAADEALAWQAHPPRGVTVRLHAYIAPAGAGGNFMRAGAPWPAPFRVRDQAGDSLGARMAGALADVLREEPGAALLVGTDLPLLRRGHFVAALAALDAADAVFGATPDGGYYLVGLRRAAPQLFERPLWGGPDVLRETLAAAAALGLRAVTLPATLPDVDVAEDVASVLAHPAAQGQQAGRALALLRRWVAEGLV